MGAAQSRYTISDLQQFYQRIEIGDILEFPAQRGPYCHYGIYVGEYGGKRHCVIHFTAPDEDIEKIVLSDVSRIAKGARALDQAAAGPSISLLQESSHCSASAKDMSKGLEKARIQIIEVRDLLIQYPCVIINNSNDKRWVSREKSVIRDQAIRHYENRDNEKKYNVYFNNCEHFVNYIRYDNPRSLQVEKVVIGGAVVAAVGAVAAAVAAIAAGIGFALSEREDEDEEEGEEIEDQDINDDVECN